MGQAQDLCVPLLGAQKLLGWEVSELPQVWGKQVRQFQVTASQSLRPLHAVPCQARIFQECYQKLIMQLIPISLRIWEGMFL